MLKSELFQHSYCIFVKEVPDQILQKVRDYGIPSIKVLKATFEDNFFCIVFPCHLTFRIYEKELFDIYDKLGIKSGFHGQLTMGYLGKTWEVVE